MRASEGTALGSEVQLLAEARHLHRLFFPGEIENEVAARYVEANGICFAPDDPRATPAIRRIFELELDVEAIELVQRVHGRPSILTPKIQILFYLVESRARYYPLFVNEHRAHLRGLAAIPWSVLRSVGKYLKGRLLVSRYGIA